MSCGRLIEGNFGYTVVGSPLICGTRLYWKSENREEVVLCRKCSEEHTTLEEATKPCK